MADVSNQANPIPDTQDGRYRDLKSEQNLGEAVKSSEAQSASASEGVDIENVSELLEKLQKDFATRDLSQLSQGQAENLAKMPNHIRQLMAQLAEAKKSQEEAKAENDPIKKEEKRKEAEKKSEAIAKEVLIVACASTLPMSEVLEFHKNCKLGVEGINQFGDPAKLNPPLNPLTAALAGGRSAEDLDKILKQGADINFKSPPPDVMNAAHYAVLLGVDSKMMEFLIQRGVDINLKDAHGNTPLDMAVRKGDENMIKFLGEKGAKLGNFAVNKLEEEKGKEEEKEGRSRKMVEKKPEKKDQKAEDNQKQKLQEELEKARELARIEAIARSQIALEFAEELRVKVLKMKEVAKAAEAEKQQEDPKKVEAENAAKKNEDAKSVEQKSVEKLLGFALEKADINKLLFGAASQGRSVLADFLIRIGADVNHREGGVSVLEAALSSGNKSLVATLATVATAETVESAIKNAASKFAESSGMKDILENAVAAKVVTKEKETDVSKVAEAPKKEATNLEDSAKKLAERVAKLDHKVDEMIADRIKKSDVQQAKVQGASESKEVKLEERKSTALNSETVQSKTVQRDKALDAVIQNPEVKTVTRVDNANVAADKFPAKPSTSFTPVGANKLNIDHQQGHGYVRV